MATTTIAIPGKFVSYSKHAGAAKGKLTLLVVDSPARSHSPLALEVDDTAIGAAYAALSPGTALTLTVTVP